LLYLVTIQILYLNEKLKLNTLELCYLNKKIELKAI